ncbi:ROK family transcriptional regulator [Loktanella sp. 5RATIMAR09]|uniref:ROK family protein n=1 Tax=Loktanella sp. 5RATIMAR09 TaxID=1225655 RepID=UPI0006EB8416|nr:ROK family protein [Loktanella sp. 5RATIMAR09]KQI71506.1 ROK family transcriptional regulator [Loktanella sp. 5RATIMAR09]
MNTLGIDLGGTKIEARVFDAAWQEIARHRVPTPEDYDHLVDAVVDQIAWASGAAGAVAAVGVGAAGLVNPQTGLTLANNLPASGRPFPADIEAQAGRRITFLNDCRALALSEAVFGAGQGKSVVMALILGTGVSGGLVIDQKWRRGPTATGGEIGHIAAPAHVIAAHGLPVYDCGCGRKGCIEGYISGPGLQRLAAFVTGMHLTTHEIAAQRTTDMAQVWAIWCALVAELIHHLTLTLDPDVIVLGGGLTAIPDVIADLQGATKNAQIGGFSAAPLALAQGGDASGARGAAYAAWMDHCSGAGTKR